MKQVIIICHDPLTVNIRKNFYIGALQDAGIDVKYWDVSSLVHKEHKLSDELDLDLITRVKGFEAFRLLLQQPSAASAVYIVELYPKPSALSLIDLLNALNYTYLRIESYFGSSIPLSNKQRLILLWQQLIRGKLKDRLQLMWRAKVLKKPNTVKFARMFSVRPPGGTSFEKFVPINGLDYERYMVVEDQYAGKVSAEGPPLELPSRYVVFLDEYLPYHPDFKVLVGYAHVDADRYLDQMNSFFSLIEQKYGVEVIIAGHPKSEYAPEAFQHRRIIKYRTPELTRAAAFVIAHASLSFHYAILWHKPVVICYTEDLKRCNPLGYMIIRYRAAMLQVPAFCLDDLKGFELPEVNTEAYKKFKYEYLTNPETEERYNHEIVVQEILQLFDAGQEVEQKEAT